MKYRSTGEKLTLVEPANSDGEAVAIFEGRYADLIEQHVHARDIQCESNGEFISLFAKSTLGQIEQFTSEQVIS